MSISPNSPKSPIGLAVGRSLLAVLFLVAGLLKIANFAGVAGKLAAMGLPFAPLFTVAAICLEVGGGSALACGWRVPWAARLLALFLIPATLMFHDFWSAASSAEFSNQLNHFLKNLALIGALWFVAASSATQAGRGADPAGRET
ncbi:DoxX family protein [Chromobacterium vaccinii]|uniref:DoxX family protein n=1 Tax=Chromobacterium vaccinii TaxID=1108595 RepID=UPI003C717A7A